MSVWFHDNNTFAWLINDDCLNALKLVPTDSVDLVITDPPYDIKNTKAGSNSPLSKRMTKSQGELETDNLVKGFNIEVLDELVRVCKGINMYFFCNKEQSPMYIDYFVTKRGCSFDLIKWVKQTHLLLSATSI